MELCGTSLTFALPLETMTTEFKTISNDDHELEILHYKRGTLVLVERIVFVR
jgi:hypothetical protein